MGVALEECMLIAAHGWDVAGALWAGWRAAFVSRPGQQIFPLAPKCQFQLVDLYDLTTMSYFQIVDLTDQATKLQVQVD